MRTYKKLVFNQKSEIYEIGRETIRRGSTLIINGAHKLIHDKETTYQPLEKEDLTTNLEIKMTDMTENDQSETNDFPRTDSFIRADYSEDESETLIHSDNTFILSERRRCSILFKLPDTIV